MTGKIRAATLAALASSVLVLCSCEDCGGGGGGPGGVGAPCVEHDDCQAGLFCVTGVCQGRQDALVRTGPRAPVSCDGWRMPTGGN